MPRSVRVSIALILAVAVMGISSALARCVVSCNTAHRAKTDASAPSCHQPSSSAAHLARLPAPCGHDHGGGVAAAVIRPVAKAPRVSQFVAVSASLELPIAAARQAVSSFPAPRPTAISPARSAPLRI
ncbi:MAG: hypothetical protein HYS05_15645 [Acidobacteria bacterium]|nr:hypothetical protein [Acidobacteriota bacterium]